MVYINLTVVKVLSNIVPFSNMNKARTLINVIGQLFSQARFRFKIKNYYGFDNLILRFSFPNETLLEKNMLF